MWVRCNTLGIITFLLLYWPGYLWDSLRIFLFELKLNYPQCTFQETEHKRDLFNVSFPEKFLPFSHLSQLKCSILIATHETKLLIELLQMLCLIILISHKKGWWCKLFSWKYFLWCFEMGWLFESSGINFTEERQQENQGCIWSIIIWCLLLQWQCTLPGQDTKHWKTWGRHYDDFIAS